MHHTAAPVRASHTPGRAVLFLDVDGTISPVGDDITDAWGDQIEVPCNEGWPTPVLTSKTLLHQLGALPITILWVTDWERPNETFTPDLFGRSASLDQIHPQASSPTLEHLTWPKAAAVLNWLAANTDVTQVIWADDHLDREDTPDIPRRDVIATELDRRGISHHLICPAKGLGLTPEDLATLTHLIPEGA